VKEKIETEKPKDEAEEPSIKEQSKAGEDNEWEWSILPENVVAHMIKALGPTTAFEMLMDSPDLANSCNPVAYCHFIHAINVDIQHNELIYWMVGSLTFRLLFLLVSAVDSTLFRTAEARAGGLVARQAHQKAPHDRPPVPCSEGC